MSNPSTYSFLRSFEMSRIPCAGSLQESEDIKNGIGKMNIDGKTVYAGMSFNGQCHFGMPNRGGSYGTQAAPGSNFGGQPIFYSDNVKGIGRTTASTANAIRAANQRWN
jgi:hypothetical protein